MKNNLFRSFELEFWPFSILFQYLSDHLFDTGAHPKIVPRPVLDESFGYPSKYFIQKLTKIFDPRFQGTLCPAPCNSVSPRARVE